MAVKSSFLTLLLILVTSYNDKCPPAFGIHRVLGSSHGSSKSDPLQRDTLYGKVRGTLHTLHFLGGRQVQRYLGIPFASPPVGELRFEIPVPPRSWNGVRDASEMPKACPQASWDLYYVQMHVPDFTSDDIDEDCLYLNIYVPAATAQRKEEEEKGRPVLVHVHGGSNEVGMGAMFHGDVLAAVADIVVVTFNYRLGVFGFLSSDVSDLQGNYGLYDQAEAFRWVSQNIHYFGGDPGKVTIQGHSAGGNNVGEHVFSPVSKGLFRFAILMSGSPLAYWSILQDSAAFTREFADKMGCMVMAEVRSCLKKHSWRDLNRPRFKYAPGRTVFAPVVDGRFLPLPPEQALTQLPLNGEAFMTGVTRNEGSWTGLMIQRDREKHQRPFQFRDIFSQEYDSLGPFTIYLNGTKVPNFELLVYQEYKAWHDPHNATANLVSVSEITGDQTFVAPAIKVADVLSARSDNVYFYAFSHLSRLSSYPAWMGVPHGRDLFYLFGSPLSSHPLHQYTEEDQNVSRALMDLWGNFVRHGKPLRSSQPDLIFPAYEERNKSYVVITSDGSDVKVHAGQRFRARKAAFWNVLLPKLRMNLSTSASDNTYRTLTWLFVALSLALLAAVIVLSACVVHFRKLARQERYVVPTKSDD